MMIGVESELDALLGAVHAIVLDPTELLARFPAGSMSPDIMQRVTALGLLQATNDGKVRVADRRFLDTGSALAALGIPPDVILDEWEALVAHTDDVAERFIATFEEHLAPKDWRRSLGTDETRLGHHAGPAARDRPTGSPRRTRRQRRPPRT